MPRKLLAALACTVALVAASSSPALARPHVAPKDRATVGVVAPKGSPSTSGGVTAAFTSCPAAGCYNYVAGTQNATNTGASSSIMISKPFVAPGDAHSLAEIAISAGSGSSRQIVEIGWTVDNVIWPSGNPGYGKPHLFVYHWVNGAPPATTAAAGSTWDRARTTSEMC
jgi:hypothetical protein